VNNDQVEGKWEQVKGRAKKAWGELTDDDFLRAEGSVEQLYGVIQEKFGDTEEAARQRLGEVAAADSRWEELKGRARRAWGELTDDDLLKADGSPEKLLAILQEKIGDSKEGIQQKLDDLRVR
jgi:uncharacterized protein YjbJ (UPF0337 family)